MYDKNFLGNEKKVDMKIGIAITRTAMKNSPGTIALGDGGYESALEIVREEGWNMEVWLWRRGMKYDDFSVYGFYFKINYLGLGTLCAIENSFELLNGGKTLPFIGLSNSIIIHAEYNDFYWAFTYGVDAMTGSMPLMSPA